MQDKHRFLSLSLAHRYRADESDEVPEIGERARSPAPRDYAEARESFAAPLQEKISVAELKSP
jgi:hypothetical protein